MEHKSGCLICGADLIYAPEERTQACYFCKGTFQSEVACANSHYVCDSCHALSGMELIGTWCLHATSADPLAMATELMKNAKISMHGPEHHFLVPAVLISAYCNATGDGSKAQKLATARKRAEKIPGGFCGTHGNCGAGVGTGIFISVITQSTPLAKEEWSLSNLMTGRSLISIAGHGGPRCCKRDTYLSLQEAIQFVKERLHVTLGSSEVVCEFSGHNKECLQHECPFFPEGRRQKAEGSELAS
jgi:hypothetical protein